MRGEKDGAARPLWPGRVCLTTLCRGQIQMSGLWLDRNVRFERGVGPVLFMFRGWGGPAAPRPPFLSR